MSLRRTVFVVASSVAGTFLALWIGLSAQPGSLTDAQVSEAIGFGQRGKDLSVRVGTIQIQGGYCNVIVDGPMARVAEAAGAAFRQYRPFTAGNVTETMKALTYVVRLQDEKQGSSPCAARHVVLQPASARGMEGVVQPVRETLLDGSAFDRLPDSEFQVVVAGPSGEAPKVRVSQKDRAKIEFAAGVATGSEPPPTAASVPASRPTSPSQVAARELRLVVQGDGKHIADAVHSLQAELSALGITGILVQRGQAYDYLIVLAEGPRDAAATIALNPQGDVVAVAVRGAFTEKGATDGSASDLAKKLAVLPR
jgi:hypothetical protein